ncbi:tetratricopeptide repeat protein [Streptomyces sp. DSM 41033]|uniref:tetratricopeptide repeat protein n=1 Tax=Streptomyces sp. DSM 41033 TaxID=3448655 RepID=UPI00403FE2A7
MTGTGAPEEGRHLQQVTAVNGFAFGVVGADIHVFGSGQPLYLLANWRSEEPADPDWLRELPSRMLNARRLVVPFVGREGDLIRLGEWRDTGPRLAVRWLHGPGGQGKTRLATEFAARSAAAGWKVVAAFHGPDADWIRESTQDLSLTGHTGLLVVVDYADRWQLAALTWLLKNNLLHRTGVITRVLMVARTANAWPAIRGILDTYQAGTSGHALAPLDGEAGDAGPATPDERTEMFEAARDSFARVYGRPSARLFPPPDSLSGADFGLTLAVHMAALVAVDCHGSGGRPPEDMGRLTAYLLNREQLHWARLYGDGAPDSPALRPFRTPPEAMNRLVFIAGLTGALPRAGGLAVLGRLETPVAAQAMEDHAFCYPPSDAALALEPLYPDRLTEDFLALTLPGHQADHPHQAWAPGTVSTLMARTGEGAGPPAWTPRGLTFLADAAARWPHLAAYLNEILLRDPALATAGGNAALTSLASVPGIDASLFMAMHPFFPYPAPDLAPGIADVMRRLGDHVLAHTEEDATRADFHEELCVRLSAAGRHEEALESAQASVALRRPLADRDRRRYAHALHALGTALWALGRYPEALEQADEAVRLRRQLADDGSPRSAHDLAHALDNQGTLLSQVASHTEALKVRIKARDVWRRQVRKHSRAGETEHLEAMQAGLAQSLAHLSGTQLHLGRHEPALATAEEGVTLFEQLLPDPLPEDGTVPYLLPPYQQAVSALGTALLASGRTQQARAAFRQAVAMAERLVEVNPQAYEPRLLDDLSSLGVVCSMTGRHEEALETLELALTRFVRLARTNPVLHEADLARVLVHLTETYAREKGPQAALAAAEQAVDIYRRLTAGHPRVYEPAFAQALYLRGVNLARLSRHMDAVDSLSDAVAVQRRLADTTPQAHEARLAEFLAALTEVRRAADSPAHEVVRD